MLKQLRFTRLEANKLIFISDLHLGHEKDFLLQPRYDALEPWVKSHYTTPCWTAEEHRDWCRSQWDEHVDQDTTVINLGDACFRDPEGESFAELSTWPCKAHYFLWGNHNSGAKQCYDRAKFEQFGPTFGDLEVYPLRFNNIVFCGHDLVVRVGRKEIQCSHFPKRVWDHMGHKAFHVSGHSHGSDLTRLPSSQDGGKSLDVGVEVSLKYNQSFCFTYEEIYDIMSSKPTYKVDHHDETTT